MPTPDPWAGIKVDLLALRDIVCQVFKVHKSHCGPAVRIGLQQTALYARVYSVRLPSQTVVARIVAPVKPLFKTESEVAAMDYVRSRTSLPVPKVFTYCSEANNPVGAEWILMQYMPGVQMDDAWYDLHLPQKRRLALGIIDFYDQLFKLKADGCGGIYHRVNSVDDQQIPYEKNRDLSMKVHHRSRRWKSLSLESLRLLRRYCKHRLHDQYSLGPLHDISLLNYRQTNVPSHSHTLATFTSREYFKLVAFNGIPSMRSDSDLPLRQKCIELFHGIQDTYRGSAVLGLSEDPPQFYFSHGDLHDANILIDPNTGAITAILDWEAAAFRPPWVDISGTGWFEEDAQRFIVGENGPENFEFDTEPEDEEMRAFFRRELYRKNADLFWCFLGGVELRAILHAATDDPLPVGKTDIFLNRYLSEDYWKFNRRHLTTEMELTSQR